MYSKLCPSCITQQLSVRKTRANIMYSKDFSEFMYAIVSCLQTLYTMDSCNNDTM